MRHIIMVCTIMCSVVIGFRIGVSNAEEGMDIGAELFKRHCAPCHGENGIGQDPTQPTGGMDGNMNRLAPALNVNGHVWHHSPALIYEYIQKGSIDETSPMPSFGKILSEEEIKAIISYVNSLWPEELVESYKKRFKEEE